MKEKLRCRVKSSRRTHASVQYMWEISLRKECPNANNYFRALLGFYIEVEWNTVRFGYMVWWHIQREMKCTQSWKKSCDSRRPVTVTINTRRKLNCCPCPLRLSFVLWRWRKWSLTLLTQTCHPNQANIIQKPVPPSPTSITFVAFRPIYCIIRGNARRHQVYIVCVCKRYKGKHMYLDARKYDHCWWAHAVGYTKEQEPPMFCFNAALSSFYEFRSCVRQIGPASSGDQVS